MSNNWNSTTLISETHAIDVLAELCGKRWLCRGQPKPYKNLIPSIDREPRQKLSRYEKLNLERQSIDLFQSTARFFADAGEQDSINDDITTLIVLQHYGVYTRLLDWSQSPWVAAYFAVQEYNDKNGELWCFDEPYYEQVGKEQWIRWPETTHGGDPNKFDAKLTAFSVDEPPPWFICVFYTGFHRHKAQQSAYSMTARFGYDHATAIMDLLKDRSRHHLYIIKAEYKSKLRRILHEKHGIWRGSLFPDSAGAADTVRCVVFKGC